MLTGVDVVGEFGRPQALSGNLLAGVLIFASFEAFFLGVLAVVAEWLPGVIGWVSIGLGKLLATAVMAVYLLRAHPELRTALGRPTLAGQDVELERPRQGTAADPDYVYR